MYWPHGPCLGPALCRGAIPDLTWHCQEQGSPGVYPGFAVRPSVGLSPRESTLDFRCAVYFLSLYCLSLLVLVYVLLPLPTGLMVLLGISVPSKQKEPVCLPPYQPPALSPERTNRTSPPLSLLQNKRHKLRLLLSWQAGHSASPADYL